MERNRSALFLDFDNIFSGLLEVDRAAAIALAERPLEFVEYLQAMDEAAGVTRALLIRRAYLNPNGSVLDDELGNDRGRLYLNRFRPHLMRAGFEVVDCPALTSRQKNAADIRMVLDVMDVLRGAAAYDEFIIASSDADFTPLLVRLRAEDKRTIVVTAGTLSPPYRAVADRQVDEHALISLLTGAQDPDSDPPLEDSPALEVPTDSVSAPISAEQIAAAEAKALAAVIKALADSEVALNLAPLGNQVHSAVGSDVVRHTKWFGSGTLRTFILEHLQNVAVEGHFVWEPNRHPAPLGPESDLNPLAATLPPPIGEISAVSDMPRIPSSTWPSVFETLERYAASHSFNLAEATSWSRDELATNATPVGRQPLGFIVRGCMFGGASLAADPPPTAAHLSQAFSASIIDRSRSAGLDLNDADVAKLNAWLAGNGDAKSE